MDKLLKDKKSMILIIVGTIALIGVVSLLVFGITKMINNAKPEVSAQDTALTEMGLTKNEIKKLTEEEKQKLISSEYYTRVVAKDYVYNSKNKEYQDTEKTTQLVFTYLGAFEYSRIVDTIEPLMKNYNFTTTKNKELIQLYKDASTLENIESLTETNYSNVLQGLLSPAMYTALYFGAPDNVVKSVTLSNYGKFPYYDGILTIESSDKIDNLAEHELYGEFNNFISPEIDTVYQIKVRGNLVGNMGPLSMSCYIKKDNGNNLSMIGCYGGNERTFYVNEL